MLIFSVSFQFFRMSPRRGQFTVSALTGYQQDFAFCSVDWVGHVIQAPRTVRPVVLVCSLVGAFLALGMGIVFNERFCGIYLLISKFNLIRLLTYGLIPNNVDGSLSEVCFRIRTQPPLRSSSGERSESSRGPLGPRLAICAPHSVLGYVKM